MESLEEQHPADFTEFKKKTNNIRSNRTNYSMTRRERDPHPGTSGKRKKKGKNRDRLLKLENFKIITRKKEERKDPHQSTSSTRIRKIRQNYCKRT